MKFKYVKKKFLDSGFQWFDVLQKEEKKNELKRQKKKIMINHTKKSVHSGAKIDGSWTRNLKILSQLFGACFWCNSSAKSLLRQ